MLFVLFHHFLKHPSIIADSNLSALHLTHTSLHSVRGGVHAWGLLLLSPQPAHSRVPCLHRLSGRSPCCFIPHPTPQVPVHILPPQPPWPPCTSAQASGSRNNFSHWGIRLPKIGCLMFFLGSWLDRCARFAGWSNEKYTNLFYFYFIFLITLPTFLSLVVRHTNNNPSHSAVPLSPP